MARSLHRPLLDKFESPTPISPALLSGCYALQDWVHRHWPSAEARLEESLQELKSTGDRRSQAILQSALAMLHARRKALEPARLLAQESAATLQELKELWGAGLVLELLSEICRQQGANSESNRFYHESQELLRQVQEKREEAARLEKSAKSLYLQGNYGLAQTIFENGLALLREVNDLPGQARIFDQLGRLVVAQGNHRGGFSLWKAGLRLTDQLEHKPWLDLLACYRGYLALEQNERHQTREFFEESFRLSQQTGVKPVSVLALWGLGEVAGQEINYPAARDYLRKAMVICWRSHDKLGLAASILKLGQLEMARQNPTRAGQLFQKSFSMYRKLGYKPGVRLCQQNLAVLKGQKDYRPTPRRTTARLGDLHRASHLTRRETEVLRLIATGLSNAEAGEKLGLTVFTVGSYLRSIYAKLGVNSRTAAIHQAVLHKLI